MSAPEPPRELSFAELLRRFAEQTSRLMRAELELASAEFTDKLGAYAGSAAVFAAAAVLGVAAVGAFTVAVVAALAIVLPLWAAALIVTAAYAVAAFALAAAGRTRLRNVSPLPTETLQLTKEDIAWIKMRAASARK